MGKLNLPGAIPVNASSLYARNLLAFVELMIDKKTGGLAVNWDDELVKGTLIARDGAIVNTMVAGRAGGAAPSAAPAAKAKASNGTVTPEKKDGAAKRPAPKGGKT